MKLEKINPFIRYAKAHEYFIKRKEKSICYDCRLFFLLEGKGYIEVGNEKIELCENTLIYLPPRSTYRFEFFDFDSVKIAVINFDLIDAFSNKKSSLGTATEGEFDINRSPIYPIAEEFICPCFFKRAQFAKPIIEEIIEAHLLKSEYFGELSSAKLKILLFDMLAKEKRDERKTDPAPMIESYIKENYRNADLSNSEIAKAFNYHPYHVNRIIKSHTGKSLREYLIDFRLHIAKNYLTTSCLSVTEISERCGFTSYNNFIKCFREKVGISPLKYRKEKRSIGL